MAADARPAAGSRVASEPDPEPPLHASAAFGRLVETFERSSDLFVLMDAVMHFLLDARIRDVAAFETRMQALEDGLEQDAALRAQPEQYDARRRAMTYVATRGYMFFNEAGELQLNA